MVTLQAQCCHLMLLNPFCMIFQREFYRNHQPWHLLPRKMRIKQVSSKKAIFVQSVNKCFTPGDRISAFSPEESFIQSEPPLSPIRRELSGEFWIQG